MLKDKGLLKVAFQASLSLYCGEFEAKNRLGLF